MSLSLLLCALVLLMSFINCKNKKKIDSVSLALARQHQNNLHHKVDDRDTKPYYGTEVGLYQPKQKLRVNVTLGNLNETVATNGNIKNLERKLNDLLKVKNLLRKGETYKKDVNPYYDPTKDDLRKGKMELEKKIVSLKKDLEEQRKFFNMHSHQDIKAHENGIAPKVGIKIKPRPVLIVPMPKHMMLKAETQFRERDFKLANNTYVKPNYPQTQSLEMPLMHTQIPLKKVYQRQNFENHFNAYKNATHPHHLNSTMSLHKNRTDTNTTFALHTNTTLDNITLTNRTLPHEETVSVPAEIQKLLSNATGNSSIIIQHNNQTNLSPSSFMEGDIKIKVEPKHAQRNTPNTQGMKTELAKIISLHSKHS